MNGIGQKVQKVLAILLLLAPVLPLFVPSQGFVPRLKLFSSPGFFDHDSLMFHLPILIFHSLPLIVLQLAAGYWTLKGHWHGVILARLSGFLLLLLGIAFYVRMDILTGMLVLILAFILKKELFINAALPTKNENI